MARIVLYVLLFCLAVACNATGQDKESLERECDEFYSQYQQGDDKKHAVDYSRLPPKYPFNRPVEEYVCLVLQFDVNDKGRTENIEVLFKTPENASSKFDKAARKAVRRWRYDPPVNEPNSRLDNVVTKITFFTSPE